MKLLLVDHSTRVGRRLASALTACGHHLNSVELKASLVASLEDSYDVAVVVVDAITPEVMGSALIDLPLPVLVFAQSWEPDDIVAALDAGVDDVVGSPAKFGEITARLRSLARRTELQTAALEVGDLRLDTQAHRAWRSGVELRLSRREFALLETFMRHPGQVLSRSVLLESVWDPAYAAVSNVVDQYVGHLRRKIDAPFGRGDLQTVRGVGYRLRTV